MLESQDWQCGAVEQDSRSHSLSVLLSNYGVEVVQEEH